MRELVATAHPGDRLPSERDLSRRWRAARMTVRSATDALVAEGLVVRRHGSGTFVATPPVIRFLGLTSFTQDMRDRGLELHILSGDRDAAVRPIAEALGIAQWRGGLKPADKIAFIEELKSQGRRVLMVGDGLNDAPALAAAHASLSPATAADISQRAAEETLKEAERITRKGITINTFMLDDSPVLRGFVDDLTRINKGRAFYSRPDRLGEYMLVDYLTHQRKKV